MAAAGNRARPISVRGRDVIDILVSGSAEKLDRRLVELNGLAYAYDKGRIASSALFTAILAGWLPGVDRTTSKRANGRLFKL
jgi:hypothetical protein